MNEHGLMIGLHRIRKHPRFPGPDLIVRMILDQCARTAEAVARLRQLPHAMYFNYLPMADAPTIFSPRFSAR
jgi:predicted choloylglycine hydrolase